MCLSVCVVAGGWAVAGASLVVHWGVLLWIAQYCCGPWYNAACRFA